MTLITAINDRNGVMQGMGDLTDLYTTQSLGSIVNTLLRYITDKQV